MTCVKLRNKDYSLSLSLSFCLSLSLSLCTHTHIHTWGLREQDYGQSPDRWWASRSFYLCQHTHMRARTHTHTHTRGLGRHAYGQSPDRQRWASRSASWELCCIWAWRDIQACIHGCDLQTCVYACVCMLGLVEFERAGIFERVHVDVFCRCVCMHVYVCWAWLDLNVTGYLSECLFGRGLWMRVYVHVYVLCRHTYIHTTWIVICMYT
jgi:hypothetical protein